MKILYLAILMYSLFFSINKDIIAYSLTSMSIIFGFNMSYICAVYTNEKFNTVLKINNQLVSFLKENKKFLYSIIYALIGVFMCSIIGNIDYCFEFRNNLLKAHPFNVKIHLQLYLLVSLWTVYVFALTKKEIDTFLVVYKNSYSDYLNKKLQRKTNAK